METYLQFNPASTIRVEEQVSVVDNRAFLRHIPKKGSVVIDGFTEVDGAPQANQFYCDYATDSLYRDASRVLHFGSVDDYELLTVNYIAIGTVVTADDMNEIKAHMENQSIHSGGGSDNFFHKVANSVCFPYVTGGEDSWSVSRYEHDFQDYAGRPSQNYDLVNWGNTGSTTGWAIRIDDKWIKLSAINGYPGSDSVDWSKINPILSVNDRQKLDSLTEPYQIGDGFYLQNNTLYLQTANANTLGGVKVGDGFYLQNDTLYLQTANANTLGGVKVGDGLQLNSSAALCLKAATASQLGGIKIGNGLVKDLNEVLSVDLPLSNADRKLLDYLHAQLDDQLD